MVATDRSYRVVGTSPVRPDGVDKVTGRAAYGADVQLPGMLYGRARRSPHAHAIIKRIDASRALALPGVHAVVTAADFPDPGAALTTTYRGIEPLRWHLEQILASDKVLHVGHAVAAVAATDPHVAEDALELIDVEYELLPPVMSAQDATLPGAPILLDNAETEAIEGLFDPVDGQPTNIARRIAFLLGDPDAGFAQAEVVIEREFETSAAHQGYIEPPSATAEWGADGQLKIWTSTQGAFGVRSQLAELLRLPLHRVTVVPMEIGGGFGGKNSMYVDPMAALLAHKAHRPVKMTMSRREVFEAAGPTSGTRTRCKIGAMRDGSLVAGEIDLVFEAGAFPGAPVAGAARTAFATYVIPHQRVNGHDVVVNKPKVTAYRAPGAPAGAFAVESVLDELARELERDPVELRMQNAATEGDRRADGTAHGSLGGEEVMQAVQQSAHYRSELHGDHVGRGVAFGFWFNGGNESSAYATVNEDGTVSLVTGSVDIGGQRAGLAMQFAESMGIAYEDVRPTVGDTDSIGFTGNTGGSRTTFATGWAVHEAALDIRQQLEQRAATLWECDRDAVSYGDDGVLRGPAGQTMTFKEIAAQLPHSGGRVQGRADALHDGVGAAVAGHIVDVEVDPETGKVDVLRYTAVQDVGQAIHPAYVEGQIQGAAGQGTGMALHEEYAFDDDGLMRNSSFLDYRMPTALDLPEIDAILVEVPNPGHPYGVRGVGEVTLVPPMAAFSNAILDAIGVRMRTLPATPRTILEALETEGRPER